MSRWRWGSRQPIHGRQGTGQVEIRPLNSATFQDGAQYDTWTDEGLRRHKEKHPGQTGPGDSPVPGTKRSQAAPLGALPAFQQVPGGC